MRSNCYIRPAIFLALPAQMYVRLALTTTSAPASLREWQKSQPPRTEFYPTFSRWTTLQWDNAAIDCLNGFGELAGDLALLAIFSRRLGCSHR